MTDLQTNVLYYGDNLDILRRYLPDARVGPHMPQPAVQLEPRRQRQVVRVSCQYVARFTGWVDAR